MAGPISATWRIFSTKFVFRLRFRSDHSVNMSVTLSCRAWDFRQNRFLFVGEMLAGRWRQRGGRQWASAGFELLVLEVSAHAGFREKQAERQVEEEAHDFDRHLWFDRKIFFCYLKWVLSWVNILHSVISNH